MLKRSRPLTVVLVGLEGSGKSSIVRRLTSSDFDVGDSVLPTCGCALEQVEVGKHEVRVADVSGQSCFRPLLAHWQRHATGYCFVVDAADPHRFADAQLELVNLRADAAPRGIPVLVVANKADKLPPGGASGEEDAGRVIASRLEVAESMRGVRHRVVTCDTSSASRARKCFKQLVDMMTSSASSSAA